MGRRQVSTFKSIHLTDEYRKYFEEQQRKLEYSNASELWRMAASKGIKELGGKTFQEWKEERK